MKVDRERIRRYARAGARWARLLARRPSPGTRVFYGHDRIPGPGEAVQGGTAKFQRLATRFPNSPHDFTLLYLGSTWLPRDLRPLLALARRRETPIILNQNGVGYPGWAGASARAWNEPIRRALLAADHVLYQSEFCKRSADELVAEPRGTYEILYNAVDVDHFSPADAPPEGAPVVILYGDQTQAYRLELALRAFALVRVAYADARLLVTGRLVSDPGPVVDELGIAGAVEFVGRYVQRAAPTILRRAHVLLHTKVNDPCPSSVIEAMACGLPVAYPASGGTVELVGDDAGVGVPHAAGWERDDPPTADALAAAVTTILARRGAYADAARRRAVERFALEPWLDRHGDLFASLVH